MQGFQRTEKGVVEAYMGRRGVGIGRFTKPLKTQAVSQLAQTALQSVFLLLSFGQPVLLACIKDYCTDVDVETVVMERP